MKPLSFSKILALMNGNLVKGSKNIRIRTVVINPLKMRKNSMLFLFNDKKVDWNSCWLNETNVIVTDNPGTLLSKTGDANIVKVDNITKAYWDFVQGYRTLFDLPIIAVTGTCGKTTTTEMINNILSKSLRTLSTYNGNNAYYLSLPYLLSINDRTEAAVLEMGVEGPGNLKYMCKHFRPQIGVLLNIATYHLQGCGTLENYIKAKAELIDGLAPDGVLIINADDRHIKNIDMSGFKGEIVTFGFTQGVDFRADKAEYGTEGINFTLYHRKKAYRAYVPGYGLYNVYNALAAIAAAFSAGIEIEESIRRLAQFKPVRQHMELRKGINGCTIIDDTWNCTPLSMESALKTLKDLAQEKKTVAVLGHMPRLGNAGRSEYYKMGKKVCEAEIDHLIIIGEEAMIIGLKAIELGFPVNKTHFCRSAEELYKELLPLAGPDTLILFKFPYKYRLSKIPSFREFMSKIMP